MKINKRCDMAVEILRKTNDGDDLKPKELKLLEMAVNGFLNKKGYDLFTQLHLKYAKGIREIVLNL